jgi:hypothetical protein
LKPDLSLFENWLTFTAGTALGTAVALRTVDVISVNWEKKGRLSLSGWGKGAAMELAQMVGFQVAFRGADRWLPPAERLGGGLVRDVAVIGIAALGEMAPTAPGTVRRGGWRELIAEGTGGLATVFLETLIYKGVGIVPGIAG